LEQTHATLLEHPCYIVGTDPFYIVGTDPCYIVAYKEELMCVTITTVC
jgi:hypothetical protein